MMQTESSTSIIVRSESGVQVTDAGLSDRPWNGPPREIALALTMPDTAYAS